VRCSWSGPQPGFEFHHLRDKDFNFSGVANKSWDVIKMELLKCELLCSCCHRIEHSTREDVLLIAEAERYSGDLLDFDMSLGGGMAYAVGSNPAVLVT
jgi:hypothetical protein